VTEDPRFGGPTAIVTAASGQDGFILTERLLGEGHHVHATVHSTAGADELRGLRGSEAMTVHTIDLGAPLRLGELVAEVRPDEFYNLAGQSSVSASFEDPSGTWRTNADAVHTMLEALRLHSPATRFYQSSSSEMFGSLPGQMVVHDEDSPLRPQSPYAAAKAAAHLLCDGYRRAYGLRIACGILFNHESRRRPAAFLTRKVVDHVRRIRPLSDDELRRARPLAVGNLAARRDWGFAPDYVDGIVRIARQIAVRAQTLGMAGEEDSGSNYRDYILGSGELHAVWELIDRAFALAGLELDWDRTSEDPTHWTADIRRTGSVAILVDRQLIRPSDPSAILANPARAMRELGWAPRAGIDGFLNDMLDA
jgi:GDPmannose 4,6-dehydratase